MLTTILTAALLCQVAPDSADYDPATRGLSYTLGAPAVCSAGAVTPDGHLVRTLFTVRPHDAGNYSIAWDGLDDAGKPAPDGAVVKVLVNRGTYRNVGAIGQNPPSPKLQEHVPSSISSIAADRLGNFWTAHGWDESGESMRRWDADGKRLTGYGVGAFVKPNGMPYAVAVDDSFVYFSNGCFNGAQQVGRWQVTGNPRNEVPFPGTGRADGHIQVRDTTVGELQAPIPALAVSSTSLWVVDVVAGKLHRYAKATGKDLGGFAVSAPRAIAVDPQGRVWASHDGSAVGVWYANGQRVRDALTGQGTIVGLSLSADGKLLALADDAAGQVRIFTVANTTVTPTPKLTIGQKAQPGDRAADRFYELRAVALLPDGSVLVSQKEPSGGARLAKFAPDGTLAWEYFSLEFQPAGNTGAATPDTLVSASLHRYTLKDRTAGTWEYANSAHPGIPLRGREAPCGPIRCVRIGDKDFVYIGTSFDMTIWADDGKVLHPVMMVGGSDPSKRSTDHGPFGQWVWTDANGDGQIQDPPEIVWSKRLNLTKTDGRMVADPAGNLLFVSEDKSVWRLPIGPPDANGLPTYDWTQAKPVIPADPAPDGIYPVAVRAADDGTYYTTGWRKGDPQIEASTWQASGVLSRYASDGTRLWTVATPEPVVGMDAIPGAPGGVIVGGWKSAALYHYSPDGLLVGQVAPGDAMAGKSGWFDILAAISVNRDPRDGIVDVFAEDVYAGRLGWYRIDDRGLSTPGPSAPVPPPVLAVDAVDAQGVTLSVGDAKLTVPKAFIGKVKVGDKVTIGKAVAP